MKTSFCFKRLFSHQPTNSLLFAHTLVLLLTINSGAQEISEDYFGYDSIVQELSSTRADTSMLNPTSDPYSEIKFHGGVAALASRVELDLPKGLPRSINLNGVEARGGIDLMSPNWVAEGAVRTFNPESIRDGQFSLREFDLIISYHSRPQKPVSLNIGAGLAARYLEVTGYKDQSFMRSNTTPASILSAGINANFSQSVSLGAQVSLRSPMVTETIDKGALDGGLRLTGHF